MQAMVGELLALVQGAKAAASQPRPAGAGQHRTASPRVAAGKAGPGKSAPEPKKDDFADFSLAA